MVSLHSYPKLALCAATDEVVFFCLHIELLRYIYLDSKYRFPGGPNKILSNAERIWRVYKEVILIDIISKTNCETFCSRRGKSKRMSRWGHDGKEGRLS